VRKYARNVRSFAKTSVGRGEAFIPRRIRRAAGDALFERCRQMIALKGSAPEASLPPTHARLRYHCRRRGEWASRKEGDYVVIGLPLVGLLIAVAPFGGPAHSGSTAFSVAISGKPGEMVHLRAVGLPSGYIASFCTRRVCAPFRVAFALPSSGRESIELQVIENVRGSLPPKRVTVSAAGARTVSIAYPRP
jgi:hypothetical protein